MSIVAIIIGIVCAGLFVLVGPVGIIICGLMLCLAGVSNKVKDD